MENDRAVDVLRGLLRQEQGNIAVRLLESTVFVSSLSMRAQGTVKEIAAASMAHCEALTSALRDLGGEPGPRQSNLGTADLHFLDLAVVLPRLILEHEGLERDFRSAAAHLAQQPDAAALVLRIADSHLKELEALRALLLQKDSPAV